MTAEEAYKKSVCRVCEKPVGKVLSGWERYGSARYFELDPVEVKVDEPFLDLGPVIRSRVLVLDYGREFAHEDCLPFVDHGRGI